MSRRDTAKKKVPDEYKAFESLAKRLVAVPKHELDAKISERKAKIKRKPKT